MYTDSLQLLRFGNRDIFERLSGRFHNVTHVCALQELVASRFPGLRRFRPRVNGLIHDMRLHFEIRYCGVGKI
jgi:hypothetical protein